jgi:hypothetical protein
MRDELLGEDIVLWSQRQAEALRRMADRHPEAGVDWPRVIDTVESAGHGRLHEVEAEIVRALYWHLMLAAHPGAMNQREWREAAERGRRASRAHMETGAKPRIELRRLHARAVREVRLLGRFGPAEPKPLLGECSVSLDEWIGAELDTEGVLRRLRA